MKTTLLTILIVFVSFFDLIAQEDVSQYFDDGGVSHQRNQVKTSLTAMINGDFSVNYQRKFTDRLFVEVGLGKTTPSYIYDAAGIQVDLASEISSINNGGISYLINPKYSYAGDERYNFTIGLRHRYRSYQNTRYKMEVKDFTYYTSAEYIIANHILLEVGTGQGISIIDFKNGNRLLNLAFPIDIKVGYTF